MNLRHELEKLSGKTLTTLGQQRRFDVLTITPSQIVLFIQGTGKERKVH